ncbi:MAG: glycosyltransferase, partial [Acidimicrobiia bacterium]
STLSELAVMGLPAVLVPLPIAHRDHQSANAEHFVRAGAAVRVPDAELSPERLASEIEILLAPGRLAEMAAAARSLVRPEAGSSIAALVEEHANG